MISPESYAFTVSSNARYQDSNKPIIRVTGTGRQVDQPSDDCYRSFHGDFRVQVGREKH